MRLNVTLYRAMAYITGVVLIVLCVLAILQAFIADSALVNVVGTMHGILYITYVIIGFALARRLHLSRLPTIVVLLAGTIPVMTFIVERHVTHKYIEPAMASGVATHPSGASPVAGQAAGGVPSGETVTPS